MNPLQNYSSYDPNLSNETYYINYCINKILLGINTAFPAKIIKIADGLATIEEIILIRPINASPPDPIQITDIPISKIIGGNAGIIIEYQEGDTVIVLVSQRDISGVKQDWKVSTPNSNRKFNAADAIIIGNIDNKIPTTYVKITDSGGIELKCSTSQPIKLITQGDVTIETVGNINANCNSGKITGTGKITINASEVEATATTNASVTATGSITLKATNVDIEGILTINKIPYLTHEHVSGALLDSLKLPVTGVTGPVIP